jgi:hypothetical protein
LDEDEFQKLFSCTREIFILLPKWKQDALLKSAGLLDGTTVTSDPTRKFQGRTIPAGSGNNGGTTTENP